MSQTSYSATPSVAEAGQLGDSGPNDIRSYFNEESSAMDFGIMVKQGTDEQECKLPAAAGDDFIGVTVHEHQQNSTLASVAGIPADGGKASVIRKGRVWVAVEEAVAAGDSVFFRHTTGSGTQIGAFRNDADGVAEVSTLTPSVANDTVYTLDVKIGSQDYHFQVLGDASATATEICDDMRAAMALDATFTASVVATGTTTLILTSQSAGELLDITSTGPGTFAIVETTPPAPTCEQVSTARWVRGSSAAGVAQLEINLP